MAQTNRLQVALNSMAVISCGMIIAFPAVLLPDIEASGEPPTPTQVSMVGCLFYTSILASSIAVEPVLERWGRRKTLLTSVASSIVGWLLAWAFETVYALLGCFLLLGFGLGTINPCVSVYLAEVVDRRWQGPVNVLRSVFFFTGVTLMYSMGFLLQGDYRKICLISSSVPLVVVFLGLFYLRETKAWLQKPPPSDRSVNLFGPYAQLWAALKGRDDVRGPFCLLNIIAILRQLSGTAVLITFAIHFAEKVVPNANAYAVAAVMGISNIAGCLLVPVFVNRYGRRHTLIVSGVVTSWTLLVLARLPTLSGLSIVDTPSPVLLSLLTLFVVASTIFLFVSQSLVELYPIDVRNACSVVSNFNSWLASGVTIVTFPVLLKCVDFQRLLLFYASASVCSVIMAIVGVPANRKLGGLAGETPNKIINDVPLSEGANQLEMLVSPNQCSADASKTGGGDASEQRTLNNANQNNSHVVT